MTGGVIQDIEEGIVMGESARQVTTGRLGRKWRIGRCLLVMFAASIAAGGCGVFNPAFVDLVGGGTGQFATVDNPPGHVVVQFVNNTEFDEQLITYLTTTGGVDLTAAERRALKPRVRLRILVTYTNGQQLEWEFVDGSTNLIDQRFSAAAFPDLNQNSLNNAVLVCDVARVEIAPGSSIEVFMPVELRAYQLVQINVGGDQVRTEFQLRSQIPPQFRVLQSDLTDEDGNVVVQSNIGIRDFPAPAPDPLCGSVVTIIMNGTLTVPFLRVVDDNPSFDQDDPAAVAAIGGRYEFIVSIQ